MAIAKRSTKTIFSGDPLEDMEVAKHLIGNYPNVDIGSLIRVATDHTQPISSRVAAIYTLGFVDDHGESRAILTKIIADRHEQHAVRDHAAEALDNIVSCCP